MMEKQRSLGMQIDGLFEGLAVVTDDRSVVGLTEDSRAVVPGMLFLACRGSAGHGLDHLDEAIERGAVAVAWEPVSGVVAPEVAEPVLVFPVDELRNKAGVIAGRFYGDPSAVLEVAGVTGTNGKTTCTWLIAQGLEKSGRAGGLIGTLGTGRPGAMQAGTHTTPSPIVLQQELAAFRDSGVRNVAMEVSSHALDQRRIAGVRVPVAAFTNLTREHLDYHGDIHSYRMAKARLFQGPGLEHAIVNADDPFGSELIGQIDPHIEVCSISVQSGTPATGTRHLQIVGIEPRPSGLDVTLRNGSETQTFATRLIGQFNAYNVAIAVAVLLHWGLNSDDIAELFRDIEGPPGRMQAIGGGADLPLVLIDYAHTPDALANALKAVRTHCHGALWCVFGCGGNRDAGKRPEMGAIAVELANRVIVTDDNPRDEDPDQIIADVLRGMPDNAAQVERNRSKAIRDTIEAADAGDIVLIAGKGDEEIQLIGSEKRWFSDADEARRALAQRQTEDLS
ncbi:MAG: UDP-N-acetylmuramoyl-L-alanyl-D-glutamate--2,6-diaminopimelate ligase [Gammaproteobacteria bacterium]